MARLTDSGGRLLGGLDTSPARFALPTRTDTAPLTATPTPPPAPEYRPDEVVFALRCSYGTLPCITFASATETPHQARRHDACRTLVEEPEERHHCPACGGFYCQAHADPETHDCRSVLRPG